MRIAGNNQTSLITALTEDSSEEGSIYRALENISAFGSLPAWRRHSVGSAELQSPSRLLGAFSLGEYCR